MLLHPLLFVINACNECVAHLGVVISHNDGLVIFRLIIYYLQRCGLVFNLVVWLLHLAYRFGIDFMFINNSNDVFISPGFKLHFWPYQILFAKRGVHSLHILMVLIQIWWQNHTHERAWDLYKKSGLGYAPAKTTKIFFMLFNNLCTKSCLNLLLNNSICIDVLALLSCWQEASS